MDASAREAAEEEALKRGLYLLADGGSGQLRGKRKGPRKGESTDETNAVALSGLDDAASPRARLLGPGPGLRPRAPTHSEHDFRSSGTGSVQTTRPSSAGRVGGKVPKGARPVSGSKRGASESIALSRRQHCDSAHGSGHVPEPYSLHGSEQMAKVDALEDLGGGAGNEVMGGGGREFTASERSCAMEGERGRLAQEEAGRGDASVRRMAKPSDPGVAKALLAAGEAVMRVEKGGLLRPASPHREQRRRAGREAYVPSVTEDIKRWWTFLTSLRRNPLSLEFVYLNHAHPDAVHYNPYDLRIVPHAQVRRDHFYTMSAAGVTHFHDDEAEFCTLDQWEREYFLYTQIMKFGVYRNFRLWKAFRVWRRYIMAHKRRHAASMLQKKLYILNPVFRKALLLVRSTCCQLVASCKLHNLESGRPHSLQELLSRLDQQQRVVQEALSSFYEDAASTTGVACSHAMELLEERLAGYATGATGRSVRSHGGRTAGPSPRGPEKDLQLEASNSTESHRFGRMSKSQMDVSDASGHLNQPRPSGSQIGPQQEFSYAMTAARRSERRRMMFFIRLLDYLILDVQRQLLQSSLADVKQLLQPLAAADPQLPAAPPDGAAATEEAGSDEPAWSGFQPMLWVHIQLDEQLDELHFEPEMDEIKVALHKVLQTVVSSVSEVPQLMHHPDLSEFVDVGGEATLSFHARSLCDLLLDEQHDALVSSITSRFGCDLDEAMEYLQTFNYLCDMVVNNRTVTPASLRQVLSAEDGGLDAMSSKLQGFLQWLQDVDAIPTVQDRALLRVDLQPLKEAVRPSLERCIEEVHKIMPQIASERFAAFMADVHSTTSRLSSEPTSVEEFAGLLEFQQEMEERKASMDAMYEYISCHYDLMAEFNIPVEDLQAAAYATMEGDYQAFRDALSMADSRKDKHIALFKGELERQVDDLNREGLDVRLLAQKENILDAHANAEEVMAFTLKLQLEVEKQQASAARINHFQRLFALPQTRFTELEDIHEEVGLKHSLWVEQESWAGLTAKWRATKLKDVSVPALEERVAAFNKVVFKLERGLLPNKIVPRLRESVNDWKALVPVVQNLTNPDLQDRHWRKVELIIGQPLLRDDTFDIDFLIQKRFIMHKDAIIAVSTEASQEAALEAMLAQVKAKWVELEFVVNSYKDIKDVYILGSIDDITTVLEDSLVMMSTITASRFAAGILEEVSQMEASLKLFSSTLDEWTECQKQWMYLETIFCTPDIQRQLPAEARSFAQVDKQFKAIMRDTRDSPNALRAGTIQGRKEVLARCNAELERVQQNLEEYLDTKRGAFPRFYFLSNDELIEILSQSKNPAAVQPHLQKCFDGIYRLEMTGGPGSNILSMISAEGEQVAFGKNLKARGQVEQWLAATEAAMRRTVRELAKIGVRDYPHHVRSSWILEQPAQLAIVVSNIHWCSQVEECLQDEEPATALSAFLDVNVHQLAELTQLVSGELSTLQRKLVVALITIDVHNRDIVDGLRSGGCCSVDDFDWQMQLRYEWMPGDEAAVVRQVNASFVYGYEYLGAQPRLVVTPMTDRCYMTLTGAMHMKLGGAPAGPAGTGKTETTKDLAKALGMQCVVFNCGDNLDHHFMAKFFSGLAQCGAWACFDEFNRIDIEVLSVVAQQLLTIQAALRAGLDMFMFEGKEIPLVPSCAVFITMNPGYAGRTELPDNLKALFRPMAMMIPDYALVAEVMLFSEGFGEAKSLSRKMVMLYKLSSEQLSQQDHYDFGMRALKSVLVMAGTMKRAHPDLGETATLIRAMRDSNIPKFLSEDARLFNAIVADLFPGVQVPDQDHGALQQAVEAACHLHDLQPVPQFVLKVIQLFETFNVRFGVMLVGPTGSGKTQIYRSLASAMTALRVEQRHPDERFQQVQTQVLNPKSVSMGELYGQYNQLTGEWRDGLASSIVRAAVTDLSDDRKWTVFDGPVDALWIENMNTVLDDNCMLCLPNGERIKLDAATMRMLFEVQDLAVASPATVSRCGMVYVPSEHLRWRPYIRSWLNQLEARCSEGAEARLTPGVPEHVGGLFDQFMDQGLDFVKRLDSSCEPIPTVDINIAASLASWLTGLLQPSRGFEFEEELSDGAKNSLNYMFAFAYVWALGGSLDAAVWDRYDEFVRKAFEGVANFPSGSGTVFDYFSDPTMGYMFRSWEEAVPAFKYVASVPFFNLIVPTMDTTRYSFLLDLALDIERPILLTGASGTGKTCIATDLLQRTAAAKHREAAVLNFSAQTSSIGVQDSLEARLEKKRKTTFGPPAGKHLVILVDDVNMPVREQYGAQPPIELLRQLLDFNGMYDRRKLYWKDIEGTTLVAACGPPGGGRQPLTPRFVRHFTVLCLPAASETVMRRMFSAIFGGFLDHYFTADVRQAVLKPVVDCSVAIYLRIAEELLPTPAKSHYTFNLRDVSKVFQGLLFIRPQHCPEPKPTLTQLWVHEMMRVFHDRLTTDEDRDALKRMLFEALVSKFDERREYSEVFESELPLSFGTFMQMGAPADQRGYEQITSAKKLLKVLTDYLDEYNLSCNPQLHLVFFSDAVQHAIRIARILSQPRGNALLVGVGGSGKQSMTRFATYLCEYRCQQIELTRSYGMTDWREDLRRLFQATGVEGNSVTFLFTDNQIVDEGFVEDINSLLNSGEVPGLYNQEEKEKLFSDLRPWVQREGIPETRDAMWRAFIDRVRDHLHVVLCFSPVGGAFRARCRQFPSLINCTTINWFSDWPRDALLSVSRQLLGDMDLGGEDVGAAVAEMCVEIHTSVAEAADLFFQELQRRYYTTPTSYLELLKLFQTLLKTQRQELLRARDRLVNGLEKLRETNETVDSMQRELEALQPVLAEKTEQTQQLLQEVAVEKEEAGKIEAVVALEEQEVKKRTAETQLLKDDAQKEVDEVMPVLLEAKKALNALDKNDIIEIKTFQKPPVLVQVTMEGVCVLLGEKSDWDTAKRVLGDAHFINRLTEYNPDKIPDRAIRGLQPIINNPQFTPEQVANQSKAAKSMCMWVRAMDTYSKVWKVVEPKRQALQQAQDALDIMQQQLFQKQAQLNEIQSQVAALERQLTLTQDELKALQDQAALSQRRLTSAGKLTTALGDEAIRWTETTQGINERMEVLVGDAFLSAACVSYTGAFTGAYREELIRRWLDRCSALSIPVSPDFSLQRTLTTAVQVREWTFQGLPTDAVSIDNGILVKHGRRWPLMIDPQVQALTWIRGMEGSNGLRIVKSSDSNLLRTLEGCIRIGCPLLLQDIGETLDPAINPLLDQEIFTQGNRQLIRLGDEDIDYDPNFKFFMTTKLPNPHYLPEVCIKVTLINFTVTFQGLEDQLLGDVVRKERPDLEEQKDRLVVSLSNDKRQLVDLEDRVLTLLKESQGNILDDQQVIDTLDSSKATSGVIKTRVREAEETEQSINEAREQYRSVPTRAAVLYFVIADLARMDPMYQYSLAYFKSLFNHCIDASAPSHELQIRLNNLMEFTTSFMYRMVCRGLFEVHKPIFSFLICTSILRQAGTITQEEWGFLLRGGRSTEEVPPVPKDTPWLTQSAWSGAHALQQLLPAAFSGLAAALKSPQLQPRWEVVMLPEWSPLQPLPGRWGAANTATDEHPAIAPFHKLLLIKILREDQLKRAILEYVAEQLGHEFTESPSSRLAEVFADSNCRTPIIFILSQGVDPMATLQRFAEQHGFAHGDGLAVISLGQGQGPVAEAAIRAAAKRGHWVCLQNCHVARSWMPRLERLVEELQTDGTVQDGFRLWLTSMPAPHFPILVLQCGIKVALEPPQGIRANLLRSIGDLPDGFLDSVPGEADGSWRKLAFCCSLFHAVIQERRKFGALGWNIAYQFSNGDLECALQTLRKLLQAGAAAPLSAAKFPDTGSASAVPWDALRYVTGHIIYGGRVTDDNDRHLLLSILGRFYTEDVLQPGHRFTPSGTYCLPDSGGLQAYMEYVRGLPMNDNPEIFGMSANANIAFNLQETRKVINIVLSIQPRLSGGAGASKSADEVVQDAAQELMQGLPSLLDQEQASVLRNPFAPLSCGHDNSLGTVLQQEMARLNRLLSVMLSSLEDLWKAVQGLVVMAAELEQMFTCILNNQVPEVWRAAAYPSLKPLASWIADFKQRWSFLASWLTAGQPASFWLPGLFFPQGFLTAVLQNHARQTQIPIDHLRFAFQVSELWRGEDVPAGPGEGVLIHGLFMEAARWDPAGSSISDALPGQMRSSLPVIHFIPTKGGEAAASEYQCPLYKTATRAGVLSTTGQSTNFVLHLSFPIQHSSRPQDWALRGVAALCALDD